MFPHRIQAPDQAGLDQQVSARLEADPQARVIVQFANAEQYDTELLQAIDALCARFGQRLNLRFYSHYPGSGFDGRTLSALPHVQSLSLDCLDQLQHHEILGELPQLKDFALQVISAHLPDLLALPNFRQLQQLRLSQDKGAAIDLAPLAQMPELHNLSISVQSRNLDALAQCPNISVLSLHRMPAKTSLGMVAAMAGLRSLAVTFGSRDAMPELHHAQLTELEILRVRGLNQLDLGGFPQLEILKIEDQAQLSCLDLAAAPDLRMMRLANLKALSQLKALKASSITDLRIINAPALDVLALFEQQLPPGLEQLKLLGGKRSLDQQIEARQLQLGIPVPQGPF
ncbi:hypothetical protein [Pseudomonas sp. PH1b]|uniref:hypothetical protein n=1 Tax=Pseudomonas sp. PH1b TaxID=1397282 RepID=UPI00046907FF|nr:hypothetical protein [Pseudomonas sp. PH1b]